MRDGYSMDAKWDTEVGYRVDTDTVRRGLSVLRSWSRRATPSGGRVKMRSRLRGVVYWRWVGLILTLL